MPYADVNDIRMYYEERGDGAPLLLLHGAAGTIDDPTGVSNWRDLLPLLAGHYRAIQIEHRGHGRTNNPSGALDYEAIAGDVCAFIAQRGLAPAHLAGVSDGGIVALQIGLTCPALVRTVVGIGVNYRVDAQVRAALDFFDPELVELVQPAWADDLARRHDAMRSPGYWRVLLRQLAANGPGSVSWTG